ncbi:OprD family porin [Phytopseudomonas dryadis]|uniref:Outer membrane porin, OprD family n=1 Tax=Phytopseudomonas dryadis TaxID=2487520 RepID=A0A4Q9QXX1_9GAMM|nr:MULTISPECIES: OprD family porin [Pseudomonas]TBU89989.1 outer membrane porin, OprD family [Pseudomonas dryadis]TBV02625.1 outer membrane porin, OprD family [Pseudomonas dryadis]TBV15477.1 outer membrane porin, OprD family [Pseudomonas sp. FRB 230]
MQVMKWSVIALAVAAGTSQMAVASSQSESNGFIEDSSFNIFNRALYFNRDFRNAAPGSQSYAEETGLGIRLLYESGFTQGTVGFGFDAHSLSSIKVDSGRGRHSTGQFGTTSDGRGEDTQTEVGGAIKLRLSDTVLKYGNQFTSSPVFATDDSRILPEVATGTLLTSNEIEGLELTAGRFTAMSSQVGSGRDGINGKGEPGLTSANIVGASYAFTDNFSGAIHHSDVEDFFKKTYVNLNYNLPLSDEQALNFDFNAYKTSGDGEERYGEVDNKIWSLAAAYSLSAHTFTVAHQRSSGDAGYAYGVDGGGTVFLANSVQMRDFNGKDEKSWQARYDLDMSTFGVPGLSFMARYITGSDIDVGPGSDLNRWERNLEAKYVVQDGAAKDLSFRVRQATYRADSGYEGGKLDEVRVIVEYPLSVL